MDFLYFQGALGPEKHAFRVRGVTKTTFPPNTEKLRFCHPCGTLVAPEMTPGGIIQAMKSAKKLEKNIPEKRTLFENGKMLVQGLRVLPSPHEMSGHAGPMEPFGMEN